MVIVDHKLAGCGIVYGEEAQLFINGDAYGGRLSLCKQA